jgi:hypothetical protein
MQNMDDTDIELIWDDILSREPERVLMRYNTLLPGEKMSVLEHLKCMRDEIGWHPEQRISAQIALDIIEDVDN